MRASGQVLLQCPPQDDPGLRQRAFARVDEEQHSVDHLQPALDLAAEVGVAGGVDDVDGRALEADRGVLRENRDALLALEVHRVHDPLADRVLVRLVLGEGPGLPEHGVDEGGLAVVDVGDDRDVAKVIAGRHDIPGYLRCPEALRRGACRWHGQRCSTR